MKQYNWQYRTFDFVYTIFLYVLAFVFMLNYNIQALPMSKKATESKSSSQSLTIEIPGIEDATTCPKDALLDTLKR